MSTNPDSADKNMAPRERFSGNQIEAFSTTSSPNTRRARLLEFIKRRQLAGI